MGPTDFEVWPFDEGFRTSSRCRLISAWNAREAASKFATNNINHEEPLDWMFFGSGSQIFVREPLSGRTTKFRVRRTVSYDLECGVPA